jgi:secondary thiamine-phosphate synthase enzyme
MNKFSHEAPPPPPPIPGGGLSQPRRQAGGSNGLRVETAFLPVATDGNGQMINLSPDVSRLLSGFGMANGNVTVFCPGSTGSVTTIEFEPGLERDFPKAMEIVAPQDEIYDHNERWHDGNGHSHVRASLVGPSLTIPFFQGRLLTGQWQQVVFIDWDNKSRRRELVVQFIGE